VKEPRRLISRSHFVPFGVLDGVETNGRNVSFRLHDGTVMQLRYPAGKGWGSLLER